jgi:hypothetical protein
VRDIEILCSALADLVDQPWCVPSPDTDATGFQFADAFRTDGPAYGRDGCLGPAIIRPQLKRRYVLAFFQKLPPCLIGIEASASSHHCLH